MRLNPIFLLVLFLSTTANQANAALTATTTNVIQGTAPYLTFDSGATRVTDTDGLLGIKLSDGTHYIPVSNNAYPTAIPNTSTVLNPIILPNVGETFADVTTLVPLPSAGNTAYPTISLTNVIGAPYNYWGDDDGDGLGSGGISATGNLTVKWEDVDGTDITDEVKANPNAQLTLCNAPYKLTISSDGGTLTTQYGTPNSSTFNTSNEVYYISPNTTLVPYSCWAKPNLANTTSGYYDPSYTAWNTSKGFRLQSLGTPSKNFPTMGAHGLYFDLTVEQTTAATVISSTGATVNPISGAGVTLNLTAQSTNVVRVTLDGYKHSTNGGLFSPTTFEIKSGSTVIYSFTLSKWFIISTSDGYNYSTSNSYCSGLTGSYRKPVVNELTNANGNSNGWTGGLSGQGNTYSRRIGGGLFAEWGITGKSYYTNSDFVGYAWHLTNTPQNSGFTQSVQYGTGQIVHSYTTSNCGTSCSNHTVVCILQ